MYFNYIKPFIDFLMAVTAILLFSPFLLVIAVLIKIDSDGPVFFKQQRLGLHEEQFLLYKFRTMTHKQRTVIKQVFDGDPEVTKVGRFLRRTKLDEIPQLINVLKGDMSIVGPRPCVQTIRNKFDDNTPYRFKVKPGLTSLAAIKGSVYLSWDKKWKFDKEYVLNLSPKLDFVIILQTIKIVFLGEKKLFGNGNS